VCRVVNFTEISHWDLGGNFRKFSLTVNITDRLGTTVDLSENMHEYMIIKYTLL